MNPIQKSEVALQSPTDPQAPAVLSRWKRTPSLGETVLIWLAAAAIFMLVVSLMTPYLNLVEKSGDNSAYMAVAAAIRKWDFRGLFVKHFWGLPYFMTAVAKPTGVSERIALLLVCWLSSTIAVVLSHRLWDGWVATLFALINFDWYQRSLLGGSEPLFVALLFGSFLAIRRERWLLTTLLAALATITRPLGVLLLFGIGITLLRRRDWRRFGLAVLIGVSIGVLYVIPLARYLHDPMATVHSYQSEHAAASVPLFGLPFYAIIKGTILYPAPLTNLLLTFGWIFFVLVGIVAMFSTQRFRSYAREHLPEMIFLAPYLMSLYCYNYPHWARGNFPRFAIPVIPFVLFALWEWIPKDRRFMWAMVPIFSVLAASSAVGLTNVVHLLRGH